MVHYPKVSVIIPVFNYEKYIKESVDSCLTQTYKNLEIIVVDDGSTDSTPQILNAYGNQIIYVQQKNMGAAVALNNGIKMSTGELVCWLSADDVFLPDKIRLQVEQFNLLPDYDLVYTDFYVIDSEGKILKEAESAWHPPSRALSQILKENFINGSTVMMKKKAWEAVGGFYEKIPANVDTHMWIKLLLKNSKFLLLPEKLVKYRFHDKSQTSNRQFMITYGELVFAWAFNNIPVNLIHKGNHPNRALFYKGIKHFYIKHYFTFLACYKKIQTYSLSKFAALPLYIYIRLFKSGYVKRLNNEYERAFK